MVGFLALLLLSIAGCGESPSRRAEAGNNAGDRSETRGSNTLVHANKDATPPETPQFKTGLELHGIRFLIESPNTLAGNTVTVVPAGLEISNDPFTSPVGGEVIDAQIGDLNGDRSPEVYVFVRERGGLGKVRVIAYATNARKTMSEFVLSEPDTGRKEYSGYYGDDKFEVAETTLARKFPLYESNNGQMAKTNKSRVIQYKIKPSEATWLFYVDRFNEF